MALLPCLKCDKSYGEWKPTCPHCGTTNFFQQSLANNDPALLSAAVKTTISQVKESDRLRHNAQMSELKKLDPTTLLNRIKNSEPVATFRKFVL